MAVAIETGLDDRIEIVPTDPWAPGGGFRDHNPLGKVPVLTAEDGTVLFDSPVICEYLDSLHAGPKLFPPAGAGRWRALRQQAAADGIMDAAVARRLDRLRPPEQQDAAWQERQRLSVAHACDLLDREADLLDGPTPTIGALAAACALGYLDLRFPDEDWRAGRPRLAEWHGGFARRPSMARTVPPGS